MTDLESYVEQPGRADLVKQVRAKIKELGITYIYYQFVSVTGRIVGKGVPADHWEAMAETRVPAGLRRDRQSVPRPPRPVHRLRPGGHRSSSASRTPRPSCQLPWDKRVARVFCTLFRNREEKEDPGAFLTSDCRGNLRRSAREFQKDHEGLHLRHGCEPEMMWLKKSADGSRRRRLHQALLLPHRPVRSAAARAAQGDRLCARDGARHDPGRSRGLAGPDRAQLHLR